MIKTHISDGSGSKKSAHLHQKEKDVGLVVYTHPLKDRVLRSVPAFNPLQGIQMAVNGAFGGTPDIVHTGTDDGTHWTGSNISGTKANFNSSDQANSGTVSVLVNNPATNNVWQFDKGSNLTISSYTAITMYVYVDQDWSVTESIDIFAWDTGTAAIVGNKVAMETYISQFTFDVWQKVSIPFADLGLATGTLDALRMEMVGVKTGRNPKIYIDDIQFEETGSPVEYTITPQGGTKQLISSIAWNMVDALDTALTSNSMPSLSYNKLLNEASLSVGIGFSAIQNRDISFALSIPNINNFFIAGGVLKNAICDGTNTSITIVTEFEEPIVLDSRTKDFISIVINDDLTGLISLTAFASGRSEVVPI